MSAETLREAAAKMRKRAEGSLPGPWRVEADPDSAETFVVGERDICTVHEWSGGLSNPDHIASWHPAVALAVAEWLDATAAENDSPDGSPLGFLNFISADAIAAVAVARAYLGEAP